MRLGQLPLAALAIAALSSCGDGIDTGMAIAISRSGLSPDAVKAWIRVHVKERSCDDVKSSGADKRASYSGEVNIAAGESTVQEIRPGTYTVAVWTVSANDTPLDFGCKERIEIKDGEMADVSITVNPWP